MLARNSLFGPVGVVRRVLGHAQLLLGANQFLRAGLQHLVLLQQLAIGFHAPGVDAGQQRRIPPDHQVQGDDGDQREQRHVVLYAKLPDQVQPHVVESQGNEERRRQNHGNGTQSRIDLQCLTKLVTIHLRHLDVGDDDCRRQRTNPFEALGSVGRHVDAIAMGLEADAQSLSLHEAVLDDEDVDALLGRVSRSHRVCPSSVVRMSWCRRCRAPPRNRGSECRHHHRHRSRSERRDRTLSRRRPAAS